MFETRTNEEWAGFTFGNYTVIKKLSERIRYIKNGAVYEKFIDDELLIECNGCKRQRKYQCSSLRANHHRMTKSECTRCSSIEKAIGKRSGTLTVESVEFKETDGGTSEYFYNCSCSCGGKHTTLMKTFVAGKCSSCPNCRTSCKRIITNKIKYKNFADFKTYLKACAKKRKVDFDLDKDFLEDLLKKQNGLCYFSGVPISLDDSTASMDRVDSSLGYTKDNVQWVHRVVNFMKNELSQEDFIKWCDIISKNKSGPRAPAHFESFTFCC